MTDTIANRLLNQAIDDARAYGRSIGRVEGEHTICRAIINDPDMCLTEAQIFRITELSGGAMSDHIRRAGWMNSRGSEVNAQA